MIPLLPTLLRRIRHIKRKITGHKGYGDCLQRHLEGQQVNDLIRDKLLAGTPFMLSRFGRHEIRATLQPIDIFSQDSVLKKSVQYLKGEIGPFWWDKHLHFKLPNDVGFFPPTQEMIRRYSERIQTDVQELDILGSIHPEERRLTHLYPNAIRVPLVDIEPYFYSHPWSGALANKTVLVIYPFKESIEKQYAQRQLLFKDPQVLPEFSLKTFAPIQSVGGTAVEFPDWFAALDWMCNQIQGIEFDVALIGAGAYGMPLAAYIKRLGKPAIQLAGSTQILFGIRGNRWDLIPKYQQFFNEHWIRPSKTETISNAEKVEKACFW